MQISHSLEIQNSVDVIWKRLSSLEGVEAYLPIVTKSTVQGIGKGSKRISEISMGAQIYQIHEIMQDLDEINHSFTTTLDEGPIQIRGMKFNYYLKSLGKNKSRLIMSTNAVNPDAQFMAKNIFEMIGLGLKKIHEI
jgi:hypothetical protein